MHIGIIQPLERRAHKARVRKSDPRQPDLFGDRDGARVTGQEPGALSVADHRPVANTLQEAVAAPPTEAKGCEPTAEHGARLSPLVSPASPPKPASRVIDTPVGTGSGDASASAEPIPREPARQRRWRIPGHAARRHVPTGR